MSEQPTGGSSRSARVFVETPGRLHFGVLDPFGCRGRVFAGLGAPAPGPVLRVSACASDAWCVRGEDAGRAEAFARRFLAAHGLPATGDVQVHHALPAHAGLGSGTQLALAVGRALAEVHGLGHDPVVLAESVGRTRRSSVGIWTFAGGGLVLDGGRVPGETRCGPLLARVSLPESWRCVVGIPEAQPGMSGEQEARVLAGLPAPPRHEVEALAHLVELRLLPAAREHDFAAFGAALTDVQEVTGRWFGSAQGGVYAPGATADLVAALRALGATGVGQSSWGPAVFGFVEGEARGRALAHDVRRQLGPRGRVYEGPIGAEGARVWSSSSD
ncbi:MAG: beta-ribofuranosylaminobenzene 5'-phosphate synthase family protein [Vicinamibacterales bacterium]